MYSLIDLECEKGLKIALDDHFTNNYEAYVLGIESNEFSMGTVSLTSDVVNKFRAEEQYDRDQQQMQRLLKKRARDANETSWPLKSDLLFYNQLIKL